MTQSARRPRTTVTVAIVGALLGSSVLLAGCSGGGDTAASGVASASTMPTGAMSASPDSVGGEGTLIGADPSTWAPVIVKKGESSIELVVGQVAIAPKLRYAQQSYAVESSDASVVSVSTPDTGQLVAMQAVGAGTATVTVYRGAGKANGGKGKILAKVEVTVSEQ